MFGNAMQGVWRNYKPPIKIKMENKKEITIKEEEGKKIVSGITEEEFEKWKFDQSTPESRELLKDKVRMFLGKTYEEIIQILKEYTDLREEYYSLVALWIVGTYMHNEFNTYPYLFINAMRGSGKTRLLKLIANMSYNGEVLGSLTEAVLFRIPKGNTLCLDEFEGITRKGNEGVREMLNACYKKGSKVRRMRKKRSHDGEEQVIEEFEPFKPICMANIWGMEEVLGDRCLTMILEKSLKKDIMRIIEDFDKNLMINSIKRGLETNLVQLCSYFSVEGYIKKWNIYIKSKYTTQTTYNTYTTENTDTTLEDDYLELFNKIDDTGINGRNLELFFPLFIIADFVGDEALNKILDIAEKLNKEKREEEMTESKDVALIDFVSQQNDNDFVSVKKLTNSFRYFLGEDEKEDLWINAKWVGRALMRLSLYSQKRRVGSGIEVILNVSKAKEKIKLFKPPKEEDKIDFQKVK